MQQERLSYLLKQYKDGSLTEKETEELKTFCSPGQEPELLDWIQQRMETQRSSRDNIPAAELQALTAKILSLDKPGIREERVKATAVRRMRHSKIVRWAAAVILLLIGASVYYYTVKRTDEGKAPKISATGNDVAPGSNKAILTLANGSKVLLDSVSNGIVTSQGNSKVIKVANGMIAYNNSQRTTHRLPLTTVSYNTLTTPRGGQYQLKLPDGTKVWLNAASSITFPTAFTGNERKVKVTGETYFEVAKDPSQPFIVYYPSPIGGGQEGAVQVLGTYFNINAYNDEPAMKVTLLAGKIKILSNVEGGQSSVIRPDEQVQVNRDGSMTVNTEVDTSETVAWKNGKFKFDNTSLTELMRQLSRWYNVTVIYTGDVKENTGKYAFVGEIKRDSDLSLVLKLLELGGVHFKIDGRKLIVIP
ncbi:MAG: FecR family protein [Chitinophagaceae bacterium]|nr:MAG: FecR family protein [Chitinophagaceae bacterium]